MAQPKKNQSALLTTSKLVLKYTRHELTTSLKNEIGVDEMDYDLADVVDEILRN